MSIPENLVDRIDRAVALYRAGHVVATRIEGMYAVTSSNGSTTYAVHVDVDSWSCACPVGEHTESTEWRDACKHALAASIMADVPVQLQRDEEE